VETPENPIEGRAEGEAVLSSEAELRELYKNPSEMILKSVTNYLHEFHIAHLKLASFLCIGTARGGGIDVSPRGGEPGFVKVIGENQIGLPDWPGNNKIESMTNLLQDERIGMVFLFPGLDYFMRLSGTAAITTDPRLRELFAHEGKVPKTVILVKVSKAYFHCGKAVNRARLWEPSSRIARGVLPSVGTIMTELTKAPIAASVADAAYQHSLKEHLYVPAPDREIGGKK
jgi:hypothetical protein